MDKSRPHAEGLNSSSSALAQMLQSTADDNVDKPAAMIVSYDAAAIQDHLIAVFTLSLILSDFDDPQNRSKVAPHLDRAVSNLLRRSNVALGSINGYAVQMRRPALVQQVLLVRDHISALRAAVARACASPD